MLALVASREDSREEVYKVDWEETERAPDIGDVVEDIAGVVDGEGKRTEAFLGSP